MSSQPFNIFQALLKNTEVLFEFCRHVDVEEFVILYSLSKDFHRYVNERITTCIEGNAITRAPESAAVFQFQCYQHLCVYDPMLNLNEELQEQGFEQARDVPSFRWLRMIMFREETVDGIILEMAEAGHPLPAEMSMTLKKLWFLIDVPDNARRIGIIHNPHIWKNDDLLLATMFFIKLDMRFTDPMDGGAKPIVRRLMLAQPTLSALHMVLRRQIMRDMYDFTQLYIEWRVLPDTLDLSKSILDVPRHQCGRLQFEGRVADPRRPILLRPDELIMKEGIRRELRMDRWYLDLFLWGYVNEKTKEDFWPPSVQIKKRNAQAQQAKTEEMDVDTDMDLERELDNIIKQSS